MSREDGQFKKGHKRGGGRPRGARNKLTNKYINDLHEIYKEDGKDKLRETLQDRPEGFIKLVAALVPKDVDVKHSGDVTINIVDYQDDD